jgi:hypothetical protein
MAFAIHHQLAARLATGAALLALACPACAAISLADAASASTEADEAQPSRPAPAVEWLVRPDAQPLRSDIVRDDHAFPPSFVQTMVLADLNQHLPPGAGRREDLDLNANAPGFIRYGFTDEEPLLSEYWWQAIPGVMTTLIAGLMLYMRKPVQRKRKYRSTPHEPTGPYRRRGERQLL